MAHVSPDRQRRIDSAAEDRVHYPNGDGDSYVLWVRFERSAGDDADVVSAKYPDAETLGDKFVRQLAAELQEAYDDSGMAGSFQVLPAYSAEHFDRQALALGDLCSECHLGEQGCAFAHGPDTLSAPAREAAGLSNDTCCCESHSTFGPALWHRRRARLGRETEALQRAASEARISIADVAREARELCDPEGGANPEYHRALVELVGRLVQGSIPGPDGEALDTGEYLQAGETLTGLRHSDGEAE